VPALPPSGGAPEKEGRLMLATMAASRAALVISRHVRFIPITLLGAGLPPRLLLPPAISVMCHLDLPAR
jgi:hypothetical protein